MAIRSENGATTRLSFPIHGGACLQVIVEDEIVFQLVGRTPWDLLTQAVDGCDDLAAHVGHPEALRVCEYLEGFR